MFAACVTKTFTGVAPGALNVIVPMRTTAKLLGVAVILTVVVPVPVVGEMLNPNGIELVVQFVPAVVVTVTVWYSPPLAKFNELGDTLKVGVGV